MASISAKAKWLYIEFGLKSLRDTGSDAWLIILCRTSRMLANGTTALILALFFSALDFSDLQIGLFMTLTLAGDVLISFFLTFIADSVGRRRILIGGSVLMVAAGAVFALSENFWILLAAAVVGIISATGADFGPFRAIEESILAHLTTPRTRSDVMAWYVTTSSVGSAVGAELSGRIVHYLQGREGWTSIRAYHAIFWMYTGMGAFNMLLTLLLSNACEIEQKPSTEEYGTLLDRLDGTASSSSPPPQEKKSRFSQISRETRSIMYKLWFLLIVDSLADGMVGYSLTTYYMDLKFSMPKSTLGDIISVSYILSACSSVFAGPLARRLGLINTMVFTHLPSSAAVLLFPAPSGLFLTVALFFVRTGLNNMDQAPRSAFISAVVKAEERTAVMGVTSTLRGLAATMGPTVTGILAGNDQFWIAFVAAGALRIAYDLGLFAMFVNMKLYQHEGGGEQARGGAGTVLSDEEGGEARVRLAHRMNGDRYDEGSESHDDDLESEHDLTAR